MLGSNGTFTIHEDMLYCEQNDQLSVCFVAHQYPRQVQASNSPGKKDRVNDTRKPTRNQENNAKSQNPQERPPPEYLDTKLAIYVGYSSFVIGLGSKVNIPRCHS